MEKIIEQLNWRYAVKRYDPAQTVAPAQLQILKDMLYLAPSSFGLQPFRVIFVEDAELKLKLRQASFNQAQLTDATAVVVFAIENNIDESFVDRYFRLLCETRNMPLEGGLRIHRDNVTAVVNRKSAAEKQSWATHQAYLSLGFLLFGSAALGIDANAMEGFIPTAYDEILGLKDLCLSSVVIAAVGVRHADDHFQRLPKVRRAADEIFIYR